MSDLTGGRIGDRFMLRLRSYRSVFSWLQFVTTSLPSFFISQPKLDWFSLWGGDGLNEAEYGLSIGYVSEIVFTIRRFQLGMCRKIIFNVQFFPLMGLLTPP